MTGKTVFCAKSDVNLIFFAILLVPYFYQEFFQKMAQDVFDLPNEIGTFLSLMFMIILD